MYSEEYESLFSVSVDMDSSADDDKDPLIYRTTWDYLKITYHPPWPLHLLFTKSVMEKYVFVFNGNFYV